MRRLWRKLWTSCGLAPHRVLQVPESAGRARAEIDAHGPPRAILIAQRSLLRKTLGTLTGALDDLRGDDKMARHIRYMKPVVTAIDAAIVAM